MRQIGDTCCNILIKTSCLALVYTFSDPVYRKGEAIDNVWGFLYGTVRPICRLKVQQRILYNGHKRFQVLNFQSVTTRSWMIANLYGPVEGMRHDCTLLAMLKLLKIKAVFIRCEWSSTLFVWRSCLSHDETSTKPI